ncbi:alkaline phosphatase, tissue-nonspecific isozyme-like [Anopheles darlingi]|uniref:alkaline phosphatase, tissue-nonspecific isozyme-like n=1 Tax=Anopheles darlingi TaxID=43151 RepID=UPI00210056B0|nr:alkaline phosphatase, tissue-nonspecific isozyme-like [Anopheles darlingi]
MKLICVLFAICLAVHGLPRNLAPTIVTEVPPEPTHPMDDPNWVPPTGPTHEKDREYWLATGQNRLRQQIAHGSDLNLRVAKNVIIFIGDGLSIPTLAATRVYMGGEEQELSFERFPHTGLAKTYCINYQVSDSACTAAAILMGVKNNYGTIGVSGHVPLHNCPLSLLESNRLTSILAYAQQDGRSTGIVTNTRITHATPAVAYAAAGARYWEDDTELPATGGGCQDIAYQLVHGAVGQNLTVALGGGSRHFYPAGTVDGNGEAGRRQDGRNLVDEWISAMAERQLRARFVHDRAGLAAIDAGQVDRLFGLFRANHMSYHLLADQSREPSLAEMTASALQLLKRNDRGFVLLVEGGTIDHAHHANLARLALDETVELHRAVEQAISLMETGGDQQETLMLVTADHSHTLTIGGYPVRGNDILSTGDFSRLDRMPFFTLTYANGMSYFDHFYETGGRRNPADMVDRHHEPTFTFPAAVPYEDETHGGDDVAVFARGPWSHLFSGLYEQHVIGHGLLYAACLGPEEFERSEACRERIRGAASTTTGCCWIALMLSSLFLVWRGVG